MRKRAIPTRRRQALRWLCAVLLLVLMNNIVHHTYYLLPVQPLWETEERFGCGRLRTVTALWEPDMHCIQRMYLRENENATLLSDVCLSFRGWTSRAGVVLDCSGGEPLYAGQMALTWQDTDTVYYIFGRVNDPAIASIHVSFRGVMTDREVLGLDTRRSEWLEQGGRTYFLLRQPPFDWLADWGESHTSITAYDSEGRVVMELNNLSNRSAYVYGIGR